MEAILNNDFISTVWKDEKVLIRTVSAFKIVETLDAYVEKFINLRTFPYVNTTYGKILNDSFENLDSKDKTSIRAIIHGYLNDIGSREKEWFLTLDKVELLKMGFDEATIDSSRKEDLFKEVKGGYYCEMLLANILLSLGYEIIISKLYFQYGSFSPTGIDVPFINLNEKILILGECKLYKKIKMAINSCYQDLSNIYNGEKFFRDYNEWLKKLPSANEKFSEIVTQNGLNSPQSFLEYIKKIICVGFVVGNKIDSSDLEKCLEDLEDFKQRDKIQLLIITIPIESKDKFVECCYNALKKMGGAIND